MNVTDAIAWAQAELQSPHPRIADVQRALDSALQGAIRLTINHDVRGNNLARLVNVLGGDDNAY